MKINIANKIRRTIGSNTALKIAKQVHIDIYVVDITLREPQLDCCIFRINYIYRSPVI